MFESAEIGTKVTKARFEREAAALRTQLLDAQYALLREARHGVVVLVNGVHGAGKSETVNVFNEWMDPRHIRTEGFGRLEAHELAARQPEMQRFWQVLPGQGRMSILFGSWYSDPIAAFATGRESHERFLHRLERIRHLERMLHADGVRLLKLWFHLSREEAQGRAKLLSADPRTAWRVTPEARADLKLYKPFAQASEEALRKTSTAEAPWHVIEGTDPAYRTLAAARLLLEVLTRAGTPAPATVAATPATPAAARPADATARVLSPTVAVPDLLASLDYTQALGKKAYKHQLEECQGRLNLLSRKLAEQGRPLVVVFEGMDAAGKGSTIRRITQALDARFYRVVPVAAPNENERAQPYLWRFWRFMPHPGKAVFFDRSWYGRVLVERVEGFCAEADWQRAYAEINELEDQLAEAGVVVVKFWLAITADEQLRRFEARRQTPHKLHKITEEDWRNRDKWPLYERAVNDMIDRTSTCVAPWQVVASDDKHFARIEVLRRLCNQVEDALGSGARSAPKA